MSTSKPLARDAAPRRASPAHVTGLRETAVPSADDPLQSALAAPRHAPKLGSTRWEVALLPATLGILRHVQRVPAELAMHMPFRHVQGVPAELAMHAVHCYGTPPLPPLVGEGLTPLDVRGYGLAVRTSRPQPRLR
eukprot:scaffold32036_cov60-Phaeocystis_antarctica.AAC.1